MSSCVAKKFTSRFIANVCGSVSSTLSLSLRRTTARCSLSTTSSSTSTSTSSSTSAPSSAGGSSGTRTKTSVKDHVIEDISPSTNNDRDRDINRGRGRGRVKPYKQRQRQQRSKGINKATAESDSTSDSKSDSTSTRSNRNYKYSTKYGTTKTIRPTPLPHPPNHPLTPYIQHALPPPPLSPTSPAESSPAESSPSPSSPPPPPPSPDQNNFKITFLGTGCGNDFTSRNPSCTALKIDGATFIFDVGEGSNQQLGLTHNNSMGPSSIKKIFITHLHLDHVGGLISLLLNIKLSVVGSYTMSQRKVRKRRRDRDRDGKDDNDNVNNGTNEKYGDDNDDDIDDDDELTLKIYGPVGLYNYIAMNLAFTFSSIKPMKVIVYELVDDYEDEHKKGSKQTQTQKQTQTHSNNHKHHQSNKRGIQKLFHANQYPELLHYNSHLIHRSIYKTKSTNTWTIQHHNTQKQHDLIRTKKENMGRNNYKYSLIEAAQVRHLPHVQTFGYVVTEPKSQPRIDAKKAMKLGVRPSPKYRLLKIGQAVLNDDGTEMVHPHQVLIGGGADGGGSSGHGGDSHDSGDNNTAENLRGRKVALIGDTCSVSKSMKAISKNCDVLIHEATLTDENKSRARARGHSTAAMAGQVARDVNARVLVLNHISSRNDLQQEIDELVQSAEDVCGGDNDGGSGCPVVAAYDLMELSIPRNGFSFDKQ